MLKQKILKFIINIIFIDVLSSKFIIKLLKPFKNIKAKEIRGKCYFNSLNIEIGEGTFINRECKFYSSYCENSKITIGENCYLGMNVSIITISHKIGNTYKRAGENYYKSITIKNGCWIGANTTILPGITVENGCIIGAGSIVTRDCRANGLYAGVPAKRIRDLD